MTIAILKLCGWLAFIAGFLIPFLAVALLAAFIFYGGWRYSSSRVDELEERELGLKFELRFWESNFESQRVELVAARLEVGRLNRLLQQFKALPAGQSKPTNDDRPGERSGPI